LSLVLAIESDPRQQTALTRIVRERVHADLIVVDSKDAAIRSINDRLPDLILLTALFSPRDEEELVNHLRTLKGAEHLQTLTIPLLATGPFGDDDKPKRGLFGKRRSSDAIETQGCAPGVFAEQIASYLKTATELKAAAEAQAQYAARTAASKHADTSLAAEHAVTSSGAAPADFASEAPAETPSEAIFARPASDAAAVPSVRPEAEPPAATVDDAFTWRPASRRHVALPEPQPAPPPVAPPAEPGARPPLLGFTTTTLGELLEREQAALSGKQDEAELDASSIERSAIGSSSIEPSAIEPSRASIEPSPAAIEPLPVEAAAVEAPPVKAPRIEAPRVEAPPIKAPLVEVPRAKTPPIEAPPVKTPPVEAPRIEMPRVEAPPIEPPRVKAPPIEAPRVETPRVKAPAPAAPQPPIAAPPPVKPPAIRRPPGPLVTRLPPLAMWARMPAPVAAEAKEPSAGTIGFDPNDLLGALRVPAPVATISYPRGVHLRRVRVAPSQTDVHP
jgi:hypothetical protein